ncbi:MAG TPA: hemolysin family protein [Actinomycetes bacterium]|jgi:CBS domain containing-hemolysin-like protein|nr:hemolysin family protein [Actinomycetes bacterium]
MKAPSTGDVWILVAIVVLTGVAAFLAAAETSLTRMGRIRAMHLAEEHQRGAAQLLRLVEDPPRFLNLVLLLVLVVQFFATALATSVAERLIGGGTGVAVAATAMTVLTFIFAEVAPKTFAVQHTDRVALGVAPFVYLLVRLPILGPLTRLLIGIGNVVTPGKGLRTGPFLSEDELRAMVDEAEKEEVIEQEEREMIHSIFEFGDTILREVMVPRPDMVTVSVGRSLQEVLEVILRSGYSRIPVHQGDIDDIVGLAYAKDVLRSLHDGQVDKPLADILRPAPFMPESMKAADCLREMRRRKSHMVIVIDEYGGTSGLVTIEDLLEEIVGEITDEYDREEPNVEPLPDGDYRVNARLGIDEVNELLDVELPSTEWDSIGGLVFNLVGDVPKEGQEVEFMGLRLRAERVQGRRLGRIRIHRLDEAELGQDAPAEARPQ